MQVLFQLTKPVTFIALLFKSSRIHEIPKTIHYFIPLLFTHPLPVSSHHLPYPFQYLLPGHVLSKSYPDIRFRINQEIVPEKKKTMVANKTNPLSHLL